MITIYMGMSIDGQIARNNDETPWSDESWESFNTHVNNSDLLVIGRKTYDIMVDEGSIEDIKIPVCVLTSSNIENINANTSSSVDGVVKYAEENNWSNIIIAGGGKTNAAFLKASIVDRMIVDIEPVVLGKSKPFFDLNYDDQTVDSLPKFTLEEFKQIENSNTMQLLYVAEK
jgi:diaminohydroxyphosphoribosylaminopyrimidine deaminase/5-amino-6-(5-phosphoribosylamino)uracil reductase